jgi:hypothetical protein
MKEDNGKRHCLKCLLREMNKDSYMENLYNYINHLDPEIKTESSLYEHRLSICKQCNYLLDGMCKACGCYVELRASIQTNTCSYGKW